MVTPSPLVDRVPDTSYELLESLLRQILEQRDAPTTRLADLPPSEINVAEVMLELEIGGAPYLLVRVLPPAGALNGKTPVSLSPREREIVRLVAKGLPNKSIADVLDISLWTVATHLRRVFAKLGVGTRAEMVARILEGGQPLDLHMPDREAGRTR
jgi:DNA-binding CsgD family transcriptional regulator